MNPNGMYEKILLTMREGRFPVARFELHNDAEKELVMTALDNIYMIAPEDEMDLVKARGDVLRNLEEQGLISIDFDSPVWVAGDHQIYYKSKIYELLCHTALEASRAIEGCLFNWPVLRKGYAELTPRGRKESRRLLACRRMNHAR